MKWWQIVLATLAVSAMALTASCNSCGGTGKPDQKPVADAGPPPSDARVIDNQGNDNRDHEINKRVVDPAKGRACHGEIFLVDVPFGTPVPPEHPAVSAQVRADLQAHLKVEVAGTPNSKLWLMDDCGQEDILVEMKDVFDGLSGAVGDGLRHQRMQFVCADGKVIAVRPDRQCTVMDWVLRQFAVRYGERDFDGVPPVDLARDCDARGQGSGWYEQSVGAFPTPNSTHEVILAIADEGGTTGHGANVELLARAMLSAPDVNGASPSSADIAKVRVERLNVLDAGGGTPTSKIALGLARFVKTLNANSPPVVLNMSFGWPPEMGVYSFLREPAVDCTVKEGPTGGAVRTALMELRKVNPDFMAFAAIGNRNQVVTYPQNVINESNACGPPSPPDLPDQPGGVERLPFFPAAWSNPAGDGCPDDALKTPLVYAVGSHGVEQADGNIGVSRPDFYAPGRQVPLTPPETGTGTSYATAVASGTAARLLLGTPKDQIPERALFLRRHTCPPGAPIKRLRVQGNNPPCQVAGMVAPAPATPTCPGPDCIPAAVSSPSSTTPGVTLTAGAQDELDSHALGLAAPQPIIVICPGGPCYVKILKPGSDKMDVVLEIVPGINANPTPTYVKNPHILIDHAGVRHKYPISTQLLGKSTYYFKDLGLPQAIAGSSEEIAKSTFWLGYYLTDSNGSTAWHEAPLDLH